MTSMHNEVEAPMPGCLCFRPRRPKPKALAVPATAPAPGTAQPTDAGRGVVGPVADPAAVSAPAAAPNPDLAPAALTPPSTAQQLEAPALASTQPLDGTSSPEPTPAANTGSEVATATAEAEGTNAQAPYAELLQVEARAGSASSTSSAYYSAGGWSHFDEEGEWLGPPAGRTHSAESVDRRARSQGLSISGAGAGGGALASQVAANRPTAPHHGLHPQHQLPPPYQTLHPHAHAHAHEPGHPAQAASAIPAAPQNGHAAAAPATTSAAVAAAAAASPKSVASSVMVVAEASSRAVAMPLVETEGFPVPPPETREALLDRVTELYAIQGRPCKACQVLLQYCKANDLKPDTLHPDLRARDMPDADGLAKVVQGVTDGLEDLASDEGWQLVRDDELRLLYKAVPKSNVHCFRARCILDAPTEHLVALSREVDLCPTWNKYCTSAHVLKEASPTDVTVYMSLYVPWPFNDVGFVVEANGADLYEEEGRLIIAFASPDSKESGVQLPAGAEKHRKVKLLRPSCMSFTPLPPKTPGGPQRTLCQVQTYVNPGISVPSFIISFVLKVLSPFVFGAVQKVLASAFKSPTGPLPSRLQQRELLYGLVKRRTEAYLAKQQQQQDQVP